MYCINNFSKNIYLLSAFEFKFLFEKFKLKYLIQRYFLIFSEAYLKKAFENFLHGLKKCKMCYN